MSNKEAQKAKKKAKQPSILMYHSCRHDEEGADTPNAKNDDRDGMQPLIPMKPSSGHDEEATGTTTAKPAKEAAKILTKWAKKKCSKALQELVMDNLELLAPLFSYPEHTETETNLSDSDRDEGGHNPTAAAHRARKWRKYRKV